MRGRLLPDNRTGCLGVAGPHSRHDGAVGDAQAFDAVHAKRCIDNRHIILTHFGGAARVPIGHGGIADEGVQPLGITILGHELPADKRLERRAIAELAA